MSTTGLLAGLTIDNRKAVVLVTGGTGFIGQRLVRELQNDGHQLIVLTRDAANARRLLGEQVTCVDSLNNLPSTTAIDVIINLAGARIVGAPWTAARRKTLRDSRIGLTEKLVDWIARASHKPRLLLNASAIGYYGIQPQGDDTPLTEDSPTQSIFMATLCHDWEAAAAKAADLGVTVALMRFGMVLGKGGALPMMLLPIKLGLGGRLGSGKQWISWIHIDDLLRAIAHLWQQHSHAPHSSVQRYNFTSPQALTQLAFSQVAAKVLHRPCIIPTPAWPMRLFMGEQSDILLEGQRVIPEQLQTTGFHFCYPDAESALRNICE